MLLWQWTDATPTPVETVNLPRDLNGASHASEPSLFSLPPGYSEAGSWLVANRSCISQRELHWLLQQAGSEISVA